MTDSDNINVDTHVDVSVNLDKETYNKYNKLTKKDLIKELMEIELECHVAKLRLNTALEDVEKLSVDYQRADRGLLLAQRDIKQLTADVDKLNRTLDLRDNHLSKSKDYIEQATAMINALTEKWYQY